jgi:hypothetical protein
MNHSKLTPEMVEGIKKDYLKGNTQKTIIYKYRISTATMYSICEGLKQKRKEKNIFEKVHFDREHYQLTLGKLAIKYCISENYVKRILYNKEFNEYMKHPDTGLKQKLQSDIVYLIHSIEYVYSHTGAEDQKVYKYHNFLKSKLFYIEFVDHPVFGWYYHCDSRGKNICDSRYAKRYFDNIEDCKKDLGKTLRKLGY